MQRVWLQVISFGSLTYISQTMTIDHTRRHDQ